MEETTTTDIYISKIDIHIVVKMCWNLKGV